MKTLSLLALFAAPAFGALELTPDNFDKEVVQSGKVWKRPARHLGSTSLSCACCMRFLYALTLFGALWQAAFIKFLAPW